MTPLALRVERNSPQDRALGRGSPQHRAMLDPVDIAIVEREHFTATQPQVQRRLDSRIQLSTGIPMLGVVELVASRDESLLFVWMDPPTPLRLSFRTDEDRLGAEPVAVLSHETWTTKFDADPSVVGQAVRIDGVQVSFVGVAPRASPAASMP